MSEAQDRAERERQAFNKGLKRQFLDRALSHLNEGPSTQRRVAYLNATLAAASGKRVLEIGSTAWTVWIDPKRGFPARLDCLNISEVELESGRALAASLGLGAKMFFHLMDAHKLDFPDETFDLVYGGAIFHHLDCKTAFSEVRRVLKGGGTFLTTEPLGMNPLAKFVRWLTPAARTPDEKPFDKVEIELLRDLFEIERIETYDLFLVPAAITSGLFFKSPVNPLTRLGDAIDRGVFAAIPPARYWARQSLFKLRKPG